MCFKNLRFLLVLSLVGLMFSCSDDEVAPENEEGLTEMRLVFKNPTDGEVVATARYFDADGPGPETPVFEVPDLLPNRTYNLSIEIIDGLRNNRDVSAHIRNNGERYQFFFSQTTPAFSNITYKDQDANGNPIGLELEVRTVAIAGSNGFLRVTLRKDVNKSAPGVAQGDVSNAEGEVRIQINFGFRIAGGGI